MKKCRKPLPMTARSKGSKGGDYMAISKAQQKAVHNYVRNNYDRIELTVNPKGKKDQIKAHASERGETLNGFINRAINETIQRDNEAAPEDCKK